MNNESSTVPDSTLREARRQFLNAAEAKKCWPCGCLHSSLEAVERAFPDGNRPEILKAATDAARKHLADVRYDCLGCAVCYPALAINALNEAGVELDENCPTKEVESTKGWPPLPGEHFALRYRAPVAVCTLTDRRLAQSLADSAGPEVSIVGTLQTENLGIERVIVNVLANPNVRFLVLCGADSRQLVGHLPGQSLLALVDSGIDERSRIIGAKGKRPVLRNISRHATEHFRRTVEVVDRVGNEDLAGVLDTVKKYADRDPGPADPFSSDHGVTVLQGQPAERMIPDPAGYFVVYVDRRRRCLSLEHYGTNGVLDSVIEGCSAAELYTPAIERELISRLDHAAYLGRELARAEAALRKDRPYIQDGVAERDRVRPSNVRCGCRPVRS